MFLDVGLSQKTQALVFPVALATQASYELQAQGLQATVKNSQGILVIGRGPGCIRNLAAGFLDREQPQQAVGQPVPFKADFRLGQGQQTGWPWTSPRWPASADWVPAVGP